MLHEQQRVTNRTIRVGVLLFKLRISSLPATVATLLPRRMIDWQTKEILNPIFVSRFNLAYLTNTVLSYFLAPNSHTNKWTTVGVPFIVGWRDGTLKPLEWRGGLAWRAAFSCQWLVLCVFYLRCALLVHFLTLSSDATAGQTERHLGRVIDKISAYFQVILLSIEGIYVIADCFLFCTVKISCCWPSFRYFPNPRIITTQDTTKSNNFYHGKNYQPWSWYGLGIWWPWGKCLQCFPVYRRWLECAVRIDDQRYSWSEWVMTF